MRWFQFHEWAMVTVQCIWIKRFLGTNDNIHHVLFEGTSYLSIFSIFLHNSNNQTFQQFIKYTVLQFTCKSDCKMIFLLTEVRYQSLLWIHLQLLLLLYRKSFLWTGWFIKHKTSLLNLKYMYNEYYQYIHIVI